MIEDCFTRRMPLIVISIDFCKAFDSIKRDKLIESLKEYKAHPFLIDKIASLYKDDETIVQYGDMMMDLKIKIISGIKQGCTGSTSLFKLVIYRILEKKYTGFANSLFKNGLLFFADDGLLIARSRGRDN
jgi:hypothetical protein